MACALQPAYYRVYGPCCTAGNGNARNGWRKREHSTFVNAVVNDQRSPFVLVDVLHHMIYGEECLGTGLVVVPDLTVNTNAALGKKTALPTGTAQCDAAAQCAEVPSSSYVTRSLTVTRSFTGQMLCTLSGMIRGSPN